MFKPTRYAAASSAPANDPLGNGLICTIDPMLANNTGTVGTASRGLYSRIIGGGSISKLGIRVSTASGNISLAVYRSGGDGRTPGTLTQIATTGAVPCPASGYAELALDKTVTVEPGDWFAISADNTTASFSANHSSTIQTNLWLGRSAYVNAAHPLPSTASAVSGASLVSAILILGIA